MANNPAADTSIEGLLEQRAQYEQWLAKLDGAANNAPAAVRSKIRGDYEARLRGVIEQLRGYSATIAGDLERHQSSQSELDGQRRQAEEELAEAEVRYAVGEYTEPEWQRIRGESDGRLQGLREQLGTVGKEISRLAEVQQLIGGPSRPPTPSPTPAPAPPPEPPAAEMIERSPPPPPPPVDDEPVVPTIRTTQPKGAPAAPVDELAFLKSVADEDLKPASRRASNPGAASQSHGGSRTVDAPPAPSEGRKSGAPGVAKTLKCGECGTLNRPTEWYCERCGAELAGI
ncbi:MAG: zinc finger Ran-binding domain-containing protein [Gemmatimonadales bacterium]